jgi:hypothetical protein
VLNEEQERKRLLVASNHNQLQPLLPHLPSMDDFLDATTDAQEWDPTLLVLAEQSVESQQEQGRAFNILKDDIVQFMNPARANNVKFPRSLV